MTSRTIVYLAVLATMLAACSDPLDNEPKGQTIPTHADLATGYAAGSVPATNGGSSQAPSVPKSDGGTSSGSDTGGAKPAGDMPAGLVSQTPSQGDGSTTSFLPPAGMQSAPGGEASGAGRSGTSTSGGGGQSGGG